MLDYKLIEALAQVIEAGGFERAARAMHLTQSAVSQRVKLLEEQIGQLLIVRSSPPRPTEAGQRLIRHYQQVRQLEGELGESLALGASDDPDFTPLRVGVNADSLATWFLDAVRPLVEDERVLLELRVADQERTHQLLKQGEVVGCVSARARRIQGCRVEPLGAMRYRLVAAPAFAAQWFPGGLTADAVRLAPALCFEPGDGLHDRLLIRSLGSAARALTGEIPRHYVPSYEKFAQVIADGWAYGALPEVQSGPLITAGTLVDLAPGHSEPVALHWHCWSLGSPLLDRLSATLVAGARRALGA